MSILTEASIAITEELINKIAVEAAMAQPGSDEGLLPTYAVMGEFVEREEVEERMRVGGKVVREKLDGLLDNAKPFDKETIGLVFDFVTWVQVSLNRMRQGKEIGEFQVGGKKEEKMGSVGKKEEKGIGYVDGVMKIDLGKDREILAEFNVEANEHLEQIEANLLALEGDPRDANVLNSLFRSFHTIKGVSGFLQLDAIKVLTHEVESLMDLARNGKLVLDSRMITLILQAKDATQALVGQVSEALGSGKMPTEVIPVVGIMEGVRECVRGEGGAAVQVTVPEKKEEKVQEVMVKEEVKEGVKEEVKKEEGKKVGAVVAQPQHGGGSGDTHVVRVNTQKLDNLIDAVGELVTVHSQLYDSAKGYAKGDVKMGRNLGQLGRITKDLQRASMSLRMVPVKPTFQKMVRLVRDLSGVLKKKVNLHLEGEETDLDRNVVEQINDPLVHLVRNALDHGLEGPEERVAAGKSEEGNCWLKAYHLGSNIVIDIMDDGRGIDTERVLKKAVEKGLVAQGQEFTKEEIQKMLFLPGFSTAKEVTEISGRGVGLDVVVKNIQNLRGSVDIYSELGKGTTFRIKIPLTMAIIDGLIVKVGEDRFILPATSVKVAMKAKREDMGVLQGKTEVMNYRGQAIPIVRLHERFNIENGVKEITEGIVLVMETTGKPYGLLVDMMVAKQEVVIKSLGSIIKKVEGVAGGAILGDGSIALILDPVALVQQEG